MCGVCACVCTYIQYNVYIKDKNIYISMLLLYYHAWYLLTFDNQILLYLQLAIMLYEISLHFFPKYAIVSQFFYIVGKLNKLINK